jgi:hypothetical protein
MIGSGSNLNNICFSKIYSNKTVCITNSIKNRPVRLLRFEKINNAKYYLVKKYYNFWQKPYSIEKLCGCEDFIIDDIYDLSVNKVTYIIEAYDCNNKKLGQHEFVNCQYKL